MFLTLTVVVVVLLHYFVIHPLFFSPLSKIPGPMHLKLSKWFILNKARTESRNVYLQKLHEKYGDAVQIGPNEVAFNSFEYMKQIYTGNFPKEFKNNGIGFYAQFGNFESKNLFSTGDSQVHLEKKKNIAKVYSKTNVLQSGDYIKQKVDQLWAPIDARLQRPINVYPMFLALAMDVVSGFEYGGQFSTSFVSEIKAGASEASEASEAGQGGQGSAEQEPASHTPQELFEGFQESSSMWFYTTLAPQFWNIVARMYGIGKKSSRAQKWIYSRFQQALQSKMLYQGPAPVSNVLQTMFQEMQNKPKHNLNEIASEIADHIAAGHETTGITLTYICWELSRPCNQHWQQKLHDECSGVTDLQELDQLPILHSIVQEACRIHSAIPGSEPRYVPEESRFAAVLPDSTRVPIPPGTIVSCQPWSLHQLERPFGTKTAQFKPQRWLQDVENNESTQEYQHRLKRMNNSMFTFGQGNRMCLGMHLALIEIKYCVAQLYSRYETKVSSEWCANVYKGDNVDVLMGAAPAVSKTDLDLDMMRMADTYTTRPIRDECWLEFQSRDTIKVSD